MKILQIAPLWESVPPVRYGGTEAVVHLLVEELVKLGHEVTLWASGDSRTSATLRSCYPVSLRTAQGIENKAPYAWQHASLALSEAGEYDIVHNHAGEEVMALSHLIPDIAMLTTMHCLITTDTKFVWDRYRGCYNNISWSQRRLMPKVSGGRCVGVVYNGIDVGSFPFQAKKEDFLLFLGRISAEKGPHLAVEVARRAGKRLVIAGKVDPADREFHRTVVEPLIDGDRVVFMGEADGKLKRELYRRASCLLMPIMWDEPFGLVMAEAMACGTPVVVANRGAAAEIVCDGKTGFVVGTIDAMVAALKNISEIDPVQCRAHVSATFDGPAMASAYVRVYEAILKGRRMASGQVGPKRNGNEAAPAIRVA